MSGAVELVRAVEGLAAVVRRVELADSSAAAAASSRAGRDWSTGSARFAVVGAGFEDVELLGLWDVVELGVLGELLSASGSVEGLGAEPSPARAGVIGRPSIPRGLKELLRAGF